MRNSAKIAQALVYAKAAYETWNVANHMFYVLRDNYNSKREYRFEIKADSVLHNAVMDWISQHLDIERLRDISVTSGRSQDAKNKIMFNVGKGFGAIELDGHKVYVYTPDEKRRAGGMDNPLGGLLMGNGSRDITLAVRSKAGRDTLINHFNALIQDNERQKAGLFLPGTWGDWSRNRDLPRRPMSTVAYDHNQGQRLLADLQTFIADEKRYDEYGMPWHRGYLLYGPPGTGKTSTAMALAYETGRDLYYLPVGDLPGDSKLTDLISDVPAGSILLLEDVDVFSKMFAERTGADDKAEKNSVTMAGMLNILDGALTPHGLVTIMTTNHYDRLDPAITRPGRVDMAEEFTVSPEQVYTLYRRFYGRDLTIELERIVTPAEAVQIFMHNDAEAAAVILKEG
jgi:hypothetical protein